MKSRVPAKKISYGSTLKKELDIKKAFQLGIRLFAFDSYEELKITVKDQITHPDKLSENRKNYSEKMVGRLDGKASNRIIDYLLNNS